MSDSNRFYNPFPEFRTPAGVPREGGKMYFYLTGSTTLSAPYTDAAHSVAYTTNPIVLNENGTFDDDVFLDPAVRYRIVFENSDGTQVWVADPYFDPMQNAAMRFAVYPGDPNGHVAGAQGSSGGTGADVIFDTVSLIIWVCTTTGPAGTAVWRSTTGQISGAVTFTGVITAPAIGVDQNDYAPTGIASASTIRLNLSADVAITGLTGGTAGRFMIVTNPTGAFRATLKTNNTGSAAGNRFSLNGDIYLDANQSVTLVYDAISAAWRLQSTPYWPVVPPPQGRLTLISGSPIMAAEVVAGTSIYYTPTDDGNLAPVYDGVSFQVLPFSELTLTLAAASHALTSLYDCFLINLAGRAFLVSGPSWTAGAVAGVIGNYIVTTALVTGVAARGTGVGSTELQRVNGIYTNKNAMTAKNGVTSYTVAANQGTYLGTFWTDATAAQVTCHMSWGQNRKWGLWNAYNRKDIILYGGDATAPYNYNIATLRKVRNTAANSITVLNGLAEEWVEASYEIRESHGNIGSSTAQISVGYNSLTVASGRSGFFTISGTDTNQWDQVMRAAYSAPPALGLAAIAALELGPNATNQSWKSGSQDAGMEYRAKWRG